MAREALQVEVEPKTMLAVVEVRKGTPVLAVGVAEGRLAERVEIATRVAKRGVDTVQNAMMLGSLFVEANRVDAWKVSPAWNV